MPASATPNATVRLENLSLKIMENIKIASRYPKKLTKVHDGFATMMIP